MVSRGCHLIRSSAVVFCRDCLKFLNGDDGGEGDSCDGYGHGDGGGVSGNGEDDDNDDEGDSGGGSGGDDEVSGDGDGGGVSCDCDDDDDDSRGDGGGASNDSSLCVMYEFSSTSILKTSPACSDVICLVMWRNNLPCFLL